MAATVISIVNLVPIIKEKLSSGGEVTIKVKGTSMRPFLLSDMTDVHLVRYAGILNRYDIVLYELPNQTFVLHRYIKSKDDEFVICGDALSKPEIIKKEQIVAIVTAFSEKGKKTSATDKNYLRKVRLWVFLKPLRPILLRISKLLWRR